METWGEGGVVYWDSGSASYLYFVLWGWEGYRESRIFLSVSLNVLGLRGFW